MKVEMLDKPEKVHAEIVMEDCKVVAVDVEVYVEDYWIATDALDSLIEVVKNEIRERLP